MRPLYTPRAPKNINCYSAVAFSLYFDYNTYMDNNLMSPAQLWANYKEDSKLKSKFIKYERKDDHTVFEAFVSSPDENGEDTLVYCYGKIPCERKNATLIYINGFDSDVEQKVFDVFSADGYSVVCFDYKGDSDKRRHTVYPPTVSYANFDNCQGHLCSFEKSPKDTCVFVWSRLLRDVISFVKNTMGQDEKIYLLSSAEGGNILWQVAGTDKRVDAILVTNNAGWQDCKGIFKYSASPEEYNFSEDKIKFISACAPQSYAKTVACPVFYASGTNCTITSMDRVENTLSLTRNDKANHTCFCANLSNIISERARKAMSVWLNNIYTSSPMPQPPSITLEEDDGALVAKAQFDKASDVEMLVLFYSYNEVNSELRHWNRIILSTASPVSEIPVRTDDERVFAYCSVFYKDGQYYSSFPKAYDLKDSKINRITPKRSHIIYERKMGVNVWVVDDATGEYIAPRIEAGAYDITGVTAPAGNLSTCVLGDTFFESSEESILQFDCCASSDRTLTVELCVETGKASYEYYTSSVEITGGEWQKFALDHTDFKTKELVPLKNWNNVKKLSFVNIDGTLVGNLIWI